MVEDLSEKLFNLVNALSRKEKRDIELLLKGLKSETSPLISVFKALQKQKRFNDSELYELVKDSVKNENNYAGRKHELYYFILDKSSLFFLDPAEKGDAYILKNIFTSLFLLEKGLPILALPYINEAYELIDSRPASISALHVLYFKILLMNRTSDIEGAHKFGKTILGKADIQLQIVKDKFHTNVLELQAMKYRRTQSLNATQESVDFYNKARNNAVFDKASLIRSLDLRLMKFYLDMDYEEHNAMVQFRKVHWKSITEKYKKFHDTISLDPREIELFKASESRYFSFLNRFITRAFSHSHQLGKETLPLLLTIQFKHPTAEIMRNALGFQMLLKLAIMLGDLKTFDTVVKTYYKSFIKDKKYVDELIRRKIFLYLGIGSFLNESYLDSRRFFHEVIEIHERSKQVQPELAEFVHIMLALISHERGQSRATLYRGKLQGQRHATKQESISHFQQTLLDSFRKYATAEKPKEKRAIIKNLITSLKDHSKTIAALNLQFDFHFIAWFESKLGGDTYAERIKKINDIE